jgi:glycerophosphoryl diester phosphodiesterase
MRFRKYGILILTQPIRSSGLLSRDSTVTSTSGFTPKLIPILKKEEYKKTTFISEMSSVAVHRNFVDEQVNESSFLGAINGYDLDQDPTSVTPPLFRNDVPLEGSLQRILGVDNASMRFIPQVVGHRGAPYMEMENTRIGFQVAADIGCDAVELDVFLLKCGTLVVFHGGGSDDNPGCLRDYCCIEGNILDYTAEEARSLKFNPSFEDFGCPPHKITDCDISCIPTLEEVLLDAKKTGITVKIELKGPGTPEPVLELVERLDMVEKCHYSSFDHSRISRIRELRPQRCPNGFHIYRTGALFGSHVPDDFVSLSLEVGASEVHLKYDTCTTSRVTEIHASGMGSMAWFRGPMGMKEDVTHKYRDLGNEDEAMYLAVMKTGVGSLCVNRPNVLVDLVGKLRSSLSEVL